MLSTACLKFVLLYEIISLDAFILGPKGNSWGNSRTVKIRRRDYCFVRPSTTSMASSSNDGSGDDAYQVIFHDDFDGTAVDRTLWGFDIGNGPNNDGWGNQEKQYYTDSDENAFTKDGSLHVRIVKESPTRDSSSTSPAYSPAYTSARLVTRSTFSFAYGKVDTRIRIQDLVKGPFCAVWALSLEVDDPVVQWPLCGEIDMMEYQSIWDYTPSTLHFEERNGGNAVSFQGPPLTPDWHVFSMEWTPDFICFSHDGIEIGRYQRPVNATKANWPYTQDNPFYLIINNALYPFWGSQPDANFTEHTMEVDYITVSQKKV